MNLNQMKTNTISSSYDLKTRNIFFVGGETAGPLMPLMAVAEMWKAEDSTINPIFLDKKKSVAINIVPQKGYAFINFDSGKLRRYWSWWYVALPFQMLYSFIRSFLLLRKFKPQIVVGAGGYLQIPVIIMAWFLNIPTLIHQQDITPTLSNKICAPFVRKITVTFEKSLKDFPQTSGIKYDFKENTKTVWTGNPSNISQQSTQEAISYFKLLKDWPTILILGGGSGAQGLNLVIEHNLASLLKSFQIIHSTGRGKKFNPTEILESDLMRYHQFEFINRMDLAYSIADIVVARAGIGTITELSKLGKASIIIPMPDSHQENNALYLFQKKSSVVLDQNDITSGTLSKVLKKILFDSEQKQSLETNIKNIMPSDATKQVLIQIKNLINY